MKIMTKAEVRKFRDITQNCYSSVKNATLLLKVQQLDLAGRMSFTVQEI